MVVAIRLPVRFPITLPVTVSIEAASAWMFDHCNTEEPKSYVESRSGTIVFARVVDHKIIPITITIKIP